MNDNRMTELIDGLRHVGNLHEFAELFGFNWYDDSDWTWSDVAVKMADDFEQAIAERTCTVAGVYSYGERDELRVYLLSCGHEFEWNDKEPPEYCPICGAKVEDQ